jgi:putative membrane protein
MRIALMALGFLTLLGVWLGPLGALLPGPFAAHMTMHMGVVAVAAPLLAFGVCGTRFDPVRKAPGLFAPIPASVLELVVVWAWHAPALHHAARHSALGLVLEQGTFALSGVFVWVSAVGGSAAQRQQRAGAGILALLLTSMHMTLLGALLALPPRPLYAHAHAGASHLGALQDQHLGGAIMLGVGGIVYLAGGLWLTASLLRGLRAQKT